MKHHFTNLILLILATSAWAQDHWNVSLVGRALTDQWTYCDQITIEGNYAYLPTGQSGLHIVDVSGSTPVEVGSFVSGSPIWGVAVSGTHAYLAADNGLYVLDVSNHNQPVLTSFLDVNGEAWAVAAAGDYVYVGTRNRFVRVISVANPAQPVTVGTIGYPNFNINSLTVAGNYLYGAIGYGMRVIDVSNPAAPADVGSFPTGSNLLWGIAVSGHYASTILRICA